MRDPNRLDSFYEELKKKHKKICPDWRFGQLLYNFLSYIGKDPFYIEEDKMLELLNDFFNSINSKQ